MRSRFTFKSIHTLFIVALLAGVGIAAAASGMSVAETDVLHFVDAFADVAPLGGSAPIPEPATCALFLAACAGAALRRRRTR